MAIDIVDFPIQNGGSFHSYVAVYQRVDFNKLHTVSKTGVQLPVLRDILDDTHQARLRVADALHITV